MRNIIFFIIILVANSIYAQDSTEINLQNEVKSRNKNIVAHIKTLNSKIENLNEEIQEIKDTTLLKSKTYELTKTWEKYDNYLVELLKNDLEFAQKHPNEKYSLELIDWRMSSQVAMNLYDEYEKTYNLFSDEIQNSKKGKAFKKALEKFKHSKVGSMAPSFSLKDLNGNKIDLSDYKNKKYVLIDFWASWCAPCREDSPFLAEIYKQYKTKNFEIISISQDENLDAWKKAIIKDKMNWINISTFENQSDIEKKYFVYGIPHKILIDKNGLIIGKWKGSGMKNINSLKKILKENL